MKNVTEKHLVCPTCATNNKNTKLELRQINFDCALYLCPRKKCKYPQGHPWLIVDHSYEDLCKLIVRDGATKSSTSMKKKVKKDQQNTFLDSVLKSNTTASNYNDYHNILDDLNSISPDTLATQSLHADNHILVEYVQTNVCENDSNIYAECTEIGTPKIEGNNDFMESMQTYIEDSKDVAQDNAANINSENIAFTQHVQYMKSEINSNTDIATYTGHAPLDDYRGIYQNENLMHQNGYNQLVTIDKRTNDINDILNFLPHDNDIQEYVEGVDTMDLDEFDQLLQ